MRGPTRTIALSNALNVIRLLPNTLHYKSTQESTTNRNLTSATTPDATRLSAKCQTWSDTSVSTLVRSLLSASTATRNLHQDQTWSNICKFTRKMTVETTTSASLTDALKATFTRVALRNTTWFAIEISMKRSLTRSKLNHVALNLTPMMRDLTKNLLYNRTLAMTRRTVSNQMIFINWLRKASSLAKKSPAAKCNKPAREDDQGIALPRINIAQQSQLS